MTWRKWTVRGEAGVYLLLLWPFPGSVMLMCSGMAQATCLMSTLRRESVKSRDPRDRHHLRAGTVA